MATGTFVVGLSGYAYLSVIGHGRFDGPTVAALSSTYLLMNILGPGIYVATEQETSRRVSAGISLGQRVAPAVRRLAVITLTITAATLLLLLISAPTLANRVFNGRPAFIGCLALAVIGSAVVFGLRGRAGGQRRFRVYAWTLITDGGVRLVGCSALALAGSDDPTAYAVALCVGPLAAAALCVRWSGLTGEPERAEAHPPAWRSAARGVGWLLAASALSMCLANLAPVVIAAMSTIANAGTTAAFAVALVLTRVPLLLMAPVQALLLPGLAAFAAAGRVAAFRDQFRNGLMAVGVLGLLFVGGVAVAGPLVLEVVFGTPPGAVGIGTMEALTVSAVLFMTIQLCQPALISLHRHAGLVLGWVVGATVFVICLLLPLDPIFRALLAQLLAPTAVLAVQAALLIGALRELSARSEPHRESAAEGEQ